MIPSDFFQRTTSEEDEGLASSPNEILKIAYQQLEEAQRIAIDEDEKTAEHITRMQLFCRRLL